MRESWSADVEAAKLSIVESVESDNALLGEESRHTNAGWM